MLEFTRTNRTRILAILTIGLMGLFVVRLFYLQIIQHEHYMLLANSEQWRQWKLPAVRGEIYALFEVEPDPEWADVEWHPIRLIRSIRDFESRIRHKLVKNIGRRSAYPRIIPLRDLLKARLLT